MNLTKARLFSFALCRTADELPGGAQRAMFFIWNIAVLLLSSLVLELLSLCLAFGTYDWGLFFGYLRVPEILLLNWLPIFLIQLLLYCAVNRHCWAFFASWLLFFLPSIGDYFKIKLRSEPFTFRDIGSIKAGLEIVGNYSMDIGKRVILCLLISAAVFLALLFFARGRIRGKLRVIVVLLIALSVLPLWRFVYSNSDLYYRTAKKNNYLGSITEQNIFIQSGFVYPFIFSITHSNYTPPADYDEESARAVLAGYADEPIPDDRRVNILVMQLESFADLEQIGVSGIDARAYKVLNALRQESISGTLVANVIGGGTIDTEHCFLSGSYGIQAYYSAAPSYVRYLSGQGYHTTGSHVNKADFYNRVNVNRYLGFDEYHFVNDYYAPLMGENIDNDELLTKEAFRMFTDMISEERSVFSFNVTISGHSPYGSDRLDSEQLYWDGDNASETTRNIINNYLFSIDKTQRYLMAELDRVRTLNQPVVLLIYGDHPPYLENWQVYSEIGANIDPSTEIGAINRYATPYLIWANDAAKAIIGNDFCGDGPTVSPGYLMNVLFNELGWKGSAFMQFTSDVMDRLTVVSTNGYYIENGEFTTTLSPEGKELLHDYECAQFWLRTSLD